MKEALRDEYYDTASFIKVEIKKALSTLYVPCLICLLTRLSETLLSIG